MTTEQRVATVSTTSASSCRRGRSATRDTRFKVFAQKGVPRNPYEKIADAAQVHRFTGCAPSVALHIPWDRVDDYGDLAKHAADLGVRIGAINSNVFQDDDYMLGSVTNPDPRIRRKATDHLLECVDIMDATGSRDLKLWFADGTNYPGQDDIEPVRIDSPRPSPRCTQRLGDDQRFLLEYKLFEPTLLHDGRAGLGHGLRPLHRPRAQGAGRDRHRPPRAGHQHRVHRRRAAAGGQARWVRLQLPLLRRRRPDGGVPPIRSSSSGSCGRFVEAADWIRAPGWRSCSTSATTSSRRSPARSAR